MTHDEILAAIAGNPELVALAVDRNTQAIADKLSDGRTRLNPDYRYDKGDFIVALGLPLGNAVLDAIEGDPLYRHAKDLVISGKLRADLPITQTLLGQMVGATFDAMTFTEAHAEALLDLARVDAPVSEWDVRCALFNDDGSLRI